MNSRWDPLWSKLAGSESRPGQLRHSSLLHRFFRQKQVLIVEKSVRLVKHLVSSTWAQPPSTLSPALSENYTFYNWKRENSSLFAKIVYDVHHKRRIKLPVISYLLQALLSKGHLYFCALSSVASLWQFWNDIPLLSSLGHW